MIPIEIDLAVTLYLGLSILILLIWIIFEWKKRVVTDKKKEDSLWQCPTCFYTYIDSRSENISECPRCKTLHKREEKE
jgi:uncharacterized paraquat-inducible protein A